jgi:beta-xylosidase
MLAACAGSSGASTQSESDALRAAGTYENPLLPNGSGGYDQCPDPNVRQWGANYFVACTSADVGGAPEAFPIRVSSDLVNWGRPHTVFTRGSHPRWAKPPAAGGLYWAPEIYRLGGKWYLLFAATASDPAKKNSMAIGAATADAIEGPWTATDEPLVSQGDGSIAGPGDDNSGRIDPTMVRDPKTGTLYLYYVYQPEYVHVVELAPDGLSVVRGTDAALELTTGEPFHATLPWEKTTVEGVEAHAKDGKFYLLYSGASTWDGSYAVGVARADSPQGPFEKHGDPILSTARGAKLVGPGHSSQWVEGPDGRTFLLYHVQERGRTGIGGPRLLAVDELSFGPDGWPGVGDGHPSESPKAKP